MADAVSATVRKQVEIGIDVVSDGETSKIGYATYIKDRLTGFAGDNPRQIALDLQDYPSSAPHGGVAGKVFKRVALARFGCRPRDLEKDIAHLRSAVAKHEAAEATMNAASPGVVARSSRISIIQRIRPMWKRSARPCRWNMKPSSTRARAAARLPGSGNGAHTGFQDLSEAEFTNSRASG